MVDVAADAGLIPSIRPPLKWAGGKRWLVPHLTEIWSASRQRRLVEPFCGGLAVTIGLQPDRALLNDINPHAMNFYRWLKHGLRVRADIEFANDPRVFYAQRTQFNRLIVTGEASSAEAAALFYYLNRTCYNGLCRFNASGRFNVPFGRYKRINYERDFTDYKEPFKHWEFSSGDFQRVAVGKDDFIYADPPYDVEFTKYAKEGFGWPDQLRLAEWLAGQSVPVVLSNQATDRIVRLYRGLGFKLKFLKAPRLINCTGDRTPAIEVFATKII
jgi:DNA adenine methylase